MVQPLIKIAADYYQCWTVAMHPYPKGDEKEQGIVDSWAFANAKRNQNPALKLTAEIETLVFIRALVMIAIAHLV